jgi:hypothetical protein
MAFGSGWSADGRGVISVGFPGEVGCRGGLVDFLGFITFFKKFFMLAVREKGC